MSRARTRPGRVRAAAWVLLALALPAPASAAIFLRAEAAVDRGYVRLFAVGSDDLGPLTAAEDGPLATFTLTQPFFDDPELGPLSSGVLERVARWRCDRADRTFTVTGRRADGTVESAAAAVRTPTCQRRLALTVPAKVKPGRRLRVSLADTWGIGGTTAEVCTARPGGHTCHTVTLPTGTTTAAATFRTSRHGRYVVSLRAPAQRLRRHVAVGVPVRPEPEAPLDPIILTTGDSMMFTVDATLGKALGQKAEVVGDVKVGAALGATTIVNWPRLARRQVAAQHPQATVVFLGTNDTYDLTFADGRRLSCCGSAWRKEYQRRVRGVMRTYAQQGRGTVLWLTVPADRVAERRQANETVNRAIRAAAVQVPGVTAVDTGAIVSPAGHYEESITVDGRLVQVRQKDGRHLTNAGARLVSRVLVERLRAAGIVD